MASSRLNGGKRFKTEGECDGCQEKFSPIKGKNHVLKCAKMLQILSCKANSEEGYLVRVSCAIEPNIYWMLIAIPKSLKLGNLDSFLRDTWVECCGHLSEFYIGGKYYASFIGDDDLDMENDSSSESDEEQLLTLGGMFSLGPLTPAFKKEVAEVLYPGLKFKYTYDMGSNLVLQVLQAIQTCPQKEVTLLMQNVPPPFTCEICEREPELICAHCRETTCQDCKKEHSCAQAVNDTYMMRSLINSPRTGICRFGFET